MKKYINLNYLGLLVICFSTACNNTSGQKSEYSDKECMKMSQKVQVYILDYKKSKDTTYLIQALPIIDTGLKYCINNQDFPDNKIWVYRCLKRYQAGIDLINSYDEEIPFKSPFGRYYYLQDFNILQYNAQGDTLNRNRCIRDLIDYIDLSFAIYDDFYNGNPLNDSLNLKLDQTLDKNRQIKSIPSVNPRDYGALISYYAIRLLLEDKDFLLKEVEKITVDHDEDGTLKTDLINLIKTGDPQKFYE